MAAAVILAAGASSRLGRPKQSLQLAGETLLERVARVSHQAGLDPVIVVLRPELDFGYAMQQLGCLVVLNEHAAEGLASSLRLGIATVQLFKAEGVVVLACDQPALTAEHLRALIAEPATVTGSGYAGKVGIPAYFPAVAFESLLQLRGDTGARDLLRHARCVPNESLVLDIDTEADLARAQHLV